MQSETGFASSHQLKSYVASKSRLKLAARAVLSADAGLLVYHGAESERCSAVVLFGRFADIQAVWLIHSLSRILIRMKRQIYCRCVIAKYRINLLLWSF